VVRRVPGRREAFEAADLVTRRVKVARRDRHELAPEPLELVTVEPPRAPLEARGVGEVGEADFGDVQLQSWVVAHERPGRAGVVEVDV